MERQLARFNHWRKGSDKVAVNTAPKTVNDAVKGKDDSKPFASQDCSADPCSCTGCSDWD